MRPSFSRLLWGIVLFAAGTVAPRFALADEQKPPEPLAGTQPLTMQGDIASQLVGGADKFLLRKIEESVTKRERHWKRDFSSPEAYNTSIEPNRKRLAHILGVRDERRKDAESALRVGQLFHQASNFQAFALRVPVFPPGPLSTIHLDGLVLKPSGAAGQPMRPLAIVIAIPDADQTPEQLVGLAPGIPPESQFVRRLAESGCVVVPALVSREMKARHNRARLTHREFLYRPAFELGRHLIGYELQKILRVVDLFDDPATKHTQIGVIGYGEGGMLALYAAALDTRIDAVAVSGYFENRNSIWQQPIDRNVFGLLDQFGDAELAAMIAPRALYVSAGPPLDVTLPSEGGAPARLSAIDEKSMFAEMARAGELVAGFRGKTHWPASAVGRTFTDPAQDKSDSLPPKQPAFGDIELGQFLNQLSSGATLAPLGEAPKADKLPDPKEREARQIDEIDRATQQLLVESPYVRAEYMKKLYDMASTKNLEEYEHVADEYRQKFYDEVIGRFDDPLLPANPRTRKAYDKEKWTGYEVVLDVWPEVFAYGILLVPKDIKPDERRPVVVCQHGLEGRSQDVVTGDQPAYHDFAARLAERGFVTFAPQNLYIFTDRFRSLQRKANPLGKTLFSIIVPQHQQITDWLASLPFVDKTRIGFYGLSYGGKSAMRIPPLVKNYCLSICSADFNEWVWKNASTRSPYSYVWTGEYEIFEFDLGSTFNYAEMAALIAPRPFMVERGHFDGVAPDETVGYEFAKVRHHYAARLGLGDRCEIEWFVGPHTINGQGTFDFLHRHLAWPKR